MNNLNDSLPDLMRRATETLEPESTDLVERGIRRGVTLRRRRTALLSLSGAAAVLATAGIVVGGTQVFGSSAPDAPAAGTPTSAANSRATTPATAAETLATLKRLVPADLRQLKSETWAHPGFFGANLLLDDGSGPSLVTATVQSIHSKKTCAEAEAGTCITRPDGTVVISYSDAPTYPGDTNPGGVLATSVELYRPDKTVTTMMSLNGPQEKGAEHTRPKPLFTVAELTRLAENAQWRHPAPQPVPTKGPGKEIPEQPGAGKPAVPVAQTLATLKKVLPKNLQVTRPETWGGGTEGRNGAAYVINDGKGLSRVDVLVTRERPVTKCPTEGPQQCTVRPDGGVAVWSTEQPVYSDGRQETNGVVSNRVEIHHPDGRVISMTSYNGPQEKDAKHTRAKPAFTTDYLFSMAGNASWKFPGARTK